MKNPTALRKWSLKVFTYTAYRGRRCLRGRLGNEQEVSSGQRCTNTDGADHNSCASTGTVGVDGQHAGGGVEQQLSVSLVSHLSACTGDQEVGALGTSSTGQTTSVRSEASQLTQRSSADLQNVLRGNSVTVLEVGDGVTKHSNDSGVVSQTSFDEDEGVSTSTAGQVVGTSTTGTRNGFPKGKPFQGVR